MIWVFILFNLLIFGSWFTLIRLFTKKTLQLVDQILAANIISIAQIVLIELIFGYLKKLDLNYLVIAQLTIVVLIWAKIFLSGADIKTAFIFPKIQLNLNFLALFLLILFIFELVWLLFLIWLMPPIEADSLLYHLPAAAHYLQDHKIYEIASPFRFWINGYPKYIELLVLWYMLWLKNNIWVDGVQLYFAIIGILAIYSTCRKLKITPLNSLIGGFLFFLSPVVITQAKSNYVDLAVGTLILLIFNFLIDDKKISLILAAIGAGILLGSKPSGIIFALIFILFMLGKNLLGFPLKPGNNLSATIKDWFKKIFIFLAILLLVGGFWYVKNLYIYHNPIWPYSLSLGNIKIFPGEVGKDSLETNIPLEYRNRSTIRNIFTTWQEKTDFYCYDSGKGGFGAVWFTIGIPAVLLGLLSSIKNKNPPLASLIISGGVALMFIPLPWWPRFSLYVLGIGAICIAWWLNRLQKNYFLFIEIMIVIGIIYNTIVSFDHLYYTPKIIKKTLFLPPKERIFSEIFNTGHAYTFINKKTANNPSKIFYGAVDMPYLLWGNDLRNRLYYFDPSDEKIWLKKILSNEINYLFIPDNSQESLLAKKYFADKLIFKDDRYEVYQTR